MPKLSETSFTDTWLRKLPRPKSRIDHYDAVCRGLGLRHAPSGLKTWFLMKRVGGKMTRHRLGRYPDLSLADARHQVIAQLQSLHITGGFKRPQTDTFQTVFERWMREDQAGNRSAREVRRALEKDALPRLLGKSIRNITRDDIEIIVETVRDRGAVVHANRLLSALKRMFVWCQSKEIVDASPIATMEKPTRERSRERTLTKDELLRVWNAAAKMGYPFGPFVQLLILTGQRRSEVSDMEWSELDLSEGLWTQPASKTKNGRSHIVHLSEAARTILNQIGRSGPLVFSTTGTTSISGFSKAKKQIDKLSSVSDWTFHDLRRTFASYTTGTLDESPAVVEKVLNHSSGAVTGIARVYQRAEYQHQRRELMERWASWVERLVAAGPKLSSSSKPSEDATRGEA